MPARVAVTETLSAAAEPVYRLLADYRVGHPSILPAKYFHDLVVEEGGVGEGTVIRFQMTALGKTRTVRGVVSEPEPGRKLVETYPESGMVTSFLVEPRGSDSCELTIATEWEPRGLSGLIERLLVPPLLRKIYREEIGNISRAACSIKNADSPRRNRD